MRTKTEPKTAANQGDNQYPTITLEEFMIDLARWKSSANEKRSATTTPRKSRKRIRSVDAVPRDR